MSSTTTTTPVPTQRDLEKVEILLHVADDEVERIKLSLNPKHQEDEAPLLSAEQAWHLTDFARAVEHDGLRLQQHAREIREIAIEGYGFAQDEAAAAAAHPDPNVLRYGDVLAEVKERYA